MKYVIFKHTIADIPRYYPVMFPDMLTHSVVAQGIAASLATMDKWQVEVFSAGTCWMSDDGEWATMSGSTSLGMVTDADRTRIDFQILNLPECLQGMLP